MEIKNNTVRDSLFDIFKLLDSSNDKEIHANKYFISAVFDYHNDTELRALLKQWFSQSKKPIESLDKTFMSFKTKIKIHEHQ